ncbi:MAG: hypothetical protein ACMUJM_23020 [bacterium]
MIQTLLLKSLRHAGSGTHATLDAVVFRKDTRFIWDREFDPYIWFNDKSSNMMSCVHYNGGTAYEPLDPDLYAAFGYAEADQGPLVMKGSSNFLHDLSDT